VATVQKRSAASLRAEAAFRARVEELGGEVLYESWRGAQKGHRVRCASGHENAPSPTNVQRGGGICRTCAGNDPKAAEAAFRARLAEVGATLVEPEWRGAIARHEAKCAAGHTCYPIPHKLPQNRVCTKCPQPVSIATWEKFRRRVEELGGEVLDVEWRGSRQTYSVRCSVGHVSQIWPIRLYRHPRFCGPCGDNSPQRAWEKFKAQIEQLGGVVLEEAWKGNNEPHSCLCSEGHSCAPRPVHVRRGIGMCRACAGADPRVAEAEFRARVAELGGEVVEPTWLGSITPHRVRCSAGHACSPTPNNVQQGGGICRECAGKAWDVFYVVADEINDTVKFGITSGNPRRRLARHARDGFESIVRLVEGLPGDLAPRLERAVLSALRDAREAPVRGREYFPARVLGLVLDVVDGWITAPAPVEEPERSAIDEAA
jgi:hypothetical protein